MDYHYFNMKGWPKLFDGNLVNAAALPEQCGRITYTDVVTSVFISEGDRQSSAVVVAKMIETFHSVMDFREKGLIYTTSFMHT